MTEEERKHMIGGYVMELSDCILNMQRASFEADKATSPLRILANCLDIKKPASRILEIKEDGTYLYDDPESKPDPFAGTMTDDTGTEHPISTIPDGARVSALAKCIQDNRDRAEMLLHKLATEGVDIRKICQVLSNQ